MNVRQATGDSVDTEESIGGRAGVGAWTGIPGRRSACGALAAAALAVMIAVGLAQAPDRAQTEALSKRATDRMRTLQREADALATQERTLLIDLQKLQVERQLREEEVVALTAEGKDVSTQLVEAGASIRALEERERLERPALEQRLVEIYKRGRGGYLRLLLSVKDLRSAGRAFRTVSALSHLDRERVLAHRRTIAARRVAVKALDDRRDRLLSLQQGAMRARAAAGRAAAARSELIASIDRRRDLNAQLAGELQNAEQKLQRALSALSDGVASGEPVVVLPLPAFQGELDWPADGLLLRRFGVERSRFGTGVLHNGIEIAAAEGTPARAIYDGTVSFADPFVGFGNVVILDHGLQSYSLYGHLGAIHVSRGTHISRAEPIGSVGAAVLGPSGLYFELRIDGKPVDPLQWLRTR
jgi:septal ring factor EnvC (AmiA/AmiB activator)